jgi:enamine deaminase RidA (YjgF/YER057c/UK114 family)
LLSLCWAWPPGIRDAGQRDAVHTRHLPEESQVTTRARLYLLPVAGHVHIYPNDAYLRGLWAPLASAMTNDDLREQVVAALAELGTAIEAAANATQIPGEPFVITQDRATLRVIDATNAISDLDEAEAMAVDKRVDLQPPAGAPF